MQKKPKKEKPRLVKVSNIDCINGNEILIGQLRRNNETEPIVWEYTVFNRMGKPIATAQHADRFEAFNEAIKIACPNC